MRRVCRIQSVASHAAISMLSAVADAADRPANPRIRTAHGARRTVYEMDRVCKLRMMGRLPRSHAHRSNRRYA